MRLANIRERASALRRANICREILQRIGAVTRNHLVAGTQTLPPLFHRFRCVHGARSRRAQERLTEARGTCYCLNDLSIQMKQNTTPPGRHENACYRCSTPNIERAKMTHFNAYRSAAIKPSFIWNKAI